jgi:hypothetical protein
LASAIASVCVATWVASAQPAGASRPGSRDGRASVHSSRVRRRPRRSYGDGLGIAPGKIKHIWLIILENKSYDATFTGLNDNTYLWRDLPRQGVLLKDYYGTGHSSFDNYISLVSGQAPQPDTQDDCKYYDAFAGQVDMSGKVATNPNYGQMVAAAGPNAAPAAYGCVYPATVPTLFNQLDAAHISWKGYAHDLVMGDQGIRGRDEGPRYCGAPYTRPGNVTDTSLKNPSTALPNDQYLPKHFPFPWFESLLSNPADCNSAHIASLFSPRNGLAQDLRREATTPAFSWITPNMCSDGHDAVCHGDNLSLGIRANAPANFTGGLYAVDLFLRRIIPEIEASAAFHDGGLIDITFDEAFPPFTYTRNSFANSTLVAPNARTTIANDSAGETISGRGAVHWEPTGPNLPLIKSGTGQQLTPGPGHNQGLDRPSNCVNPTITRPLPIGACILGGGHSIPGVQTHPDAVAPAGSDAVSDNSIVIIDQGRKVTDSGKCRGIPPGSLVGHVTNAPVMAHLPPPAGFVDTGSFTLVSSATHLPVKTVGEVCGVTLGGRTPADDPLYDFGDATTGGGDTGSLLISPYIKPGSSSQVFYNHYSWLRTVEDLFDLTGGLDGQGHLGYAAQPGLVPFGTDVFNRPDGPPRRRSGRPAPRTAGYGRLPDWLPRADWPIGVVAASLGHPGLAVEGEPIVVHLPAGEVQITVAGPAVRTHGELDPARAAFGGVFTVALSAVSGIVPLSPRAFAILDEYGAVHPLTATGGLPARIRAGQEITVTLRGDVPAGPGQLTWTPMRHMAIAAWDFTLEVN